jgi:succinate dehydrogenase/fumarate reductase cytochrome b subunit (b558 family)
MRLQREHRSFLFRRLHSITGMVPLGVFLVCHLWTSAKAMRGAEIYEHAATGISSDRVVAVLELVGVAIPLAFHAGYGVVLALRSRTNVGAYPLGANWAHALQRVSGLATLAFVLWHVVQFPLQVALGRMKPEDFFGALAELLSSTTTGGVPLAAAAYLVGLAAVSYHLSNGISGFCFTFGFSTTLRARRLIAAGAFVIGLASFVLGAETVVYFATGAPFLVGANVVHDGALAASDEASAISRRQVASWRP